MPNLIPMVLVAFAASAGASAAATDPVFPAATPKGHYAALDGLPDWGGVWVLEPGPPPVPPQMKGDYLDHYLKAKAEAAVHHGEFARPGSSFCAPPGMPYQMGVAQYPTEFLFTPGRVTLLFEAWTQVRRIFTDGRPQSDAEQTYYGQSIGHWHDGTLAVETRGVKSSALIGQGMGHSDKEVITEQIHLSAEDPNLLVDDLTITDPDALAAPWTAHYHYRRHREWELLEYVCAENDRNPADESGHAKF